MLENEDLTYKIQFEGDSHKYSRKQCDGQSADYVIVALMDDPDESLERDVLLKIVNCKSKAVDMQVLTTKPDKRIRQIKQKLDSMLKVQIENQ